MERLRTLVFTVFMMFTAGAVVNQAVYIPRAQAKKRHHSRKKRRNLDRRCLRKLRRLGVPYRIAPPTKGVRTPIYVLGGRLRHITVYQGGQKGDVLMDCWLALSLARTSKIFNVNGGVKQVIIGKAYSYRYVKNTARLSRHAKGLAVDIYAIKTDDGHTYWVKDDYEKGLGAGPTCEGKAKSRGARLLRQLACDLDRSHYFERIITPDSDREHQDHIHLSAYQPWRKPWRRPHRTALLEPQNYGRKWVRRLSSRAHPSVRRVIRIIRARRRANRRLIRARLRKKRRSKSARKKKKSHRSSRSNGAVPRGNSQK